MRIFGHGRHGRENPWEGAPPWAIELGAIGLIIIENQETTMATLDDLKSALADLTTSVAANNAEIETLLTKITAPGTSDADVESAVSQIRSLIATNTAEVTKAQAAAP